MGTITLIAATATGLMAGVFFAFSVAVMPGLADLPAEQAREAMRRINVRIQNPVFLLVFLGTAVLCGIEVFQGRIVGGLFYIVGSFLLTMFVNVPMNNRLERDRRRLLARVPAHVDDLEPRARRCLPRLDGHPATRILRPFLGRIAARPVGVRRWGSSSGFGRCSNAFSITVSSVVASPAPTQRCGPPPNGRNSCGAGLVSQRSGSNFSGSGNTSASRCVTYGLYSRNVPCLIFFPANSNAARRPAPRRPPAGTA